MVRNFGRVLVLSVAAAWFALSPSLRAETPAARFIGKPAFKEGKALGYFVWKDGDTWKVRWTTFGAEHRFTGRVVIESGQFKDFKPVDVDVERRIIAPGRPGRVVVGPRGRVRAVGPGRAPVVAEREEDHIVQETEHLLRFNTLTNDDIDGFDFKTVGGLREIRLFLTIDGVPRPAEVEVGKDNFRPQADPLVIVLP